MIEKLQTPIVFAHRGASLQAPENTMAAFELAYSLGAPALELDTMLSKDDIPVVIHDHTIDRTITGTGRVDQFNAAELINMDAGSFFSDQFKDEPVPLLRDVLKKFKEKMFINIELKNYHAPFNKLPFRVVELVKEMNMQDSILFSSFLPINLIRVRRMLLGAKTALILGEGLYWRILSSKLFSYISPDYIHPYISYITPEYIEKEHKLGRHVNVWTTNDPKQVESFAKWGVDGFITDDPEKILRLLSQKH